MSWFTTWLARLEAFVNENEGTFMDKRRQSAEVSTSESILLEDFASPKRSWYN